MGPLRDPFDRLVDKVLDPRDQPAWEWPGARVTFVVLLGPFMTFVQWRNR
jgi:hypothetical protein